VAPRASSARGRHTFFPFPFRLKRDEKKVCAAFRPHLSLSLSLSSESIMVMFSGPPDLIKSDLATPGDCGNVLGDAFQWQHKVDKAGADRRLRHAEDNRALLVLCDRLAASLTQ